MKMTRLSGVLAFVVLLSACANGPVPPDWQANVQGSTERGAEAYLTGRTRIEESEFARARTDVARTGRVDLIARVELIRCATRVASLVAESCVAFDLILADAGPSERAYANYLAGRLHVQDAALLPLPHSGVVAGGAQTLQSIKDPLSRLVAAGVLFKMGLAEPSVMDLAIDTASAQGWSRPLLAWLHVQVKRAESAGDATAATRIRRRIDLILQTPIPQL